MQRLRWLSVALVLGALLLAAACGDDDTDAAATSTATPNATAAAQATFAPGSAMARLVAAGKLTVGVKFDQPGFGLRDASGKIDGFDVAIAREIGRALGLREDQVTFVEVTSANRVQYLNEGRVDLVAASMTITDARRQEVDFSRIYFRAGQSLLIRRDNTSIVNVTSVNRRKVCSVAGSTSAENIRNRAGQVDLVTMDTYSACVAALKAGAVEAVTTDDAILAGFVKADSSLRLIGGAFSVEPYGIAVKKGQPELVAFIDSVINAMLRDGRWDRFYTQYFGGIEGLESAQAMHASLPAAN